MKVPLLDLNTQNHSMREELQAAFLQVVDSSQFILGSHVAEFENSVAESLGAKDAIGVSSGTDALLVALMALDVKAGDEVLCPSFTFFATAGCISRLGAVPVFVDVREDNFQIDLEDAARKITDRTTAILPVHLFGQAADMDGVMELAESKGLRVIEDCAQSMGARWKENEVGTIGDLGTFSFFPTKNLGGFGDGGMVVTNDAKLGEKVRVLRAHGSKPKYYHSMVGGNFRLDALQAALLRVKYGQMEAYIGARRKNAAYYMEAFAQHTKALEGKIVLPFESEDCWHTWNQFTIRVQGGKRDDLREFLKNREIASEIYYPLSLHQQECFANLPQQKCPVSEKLTQEVLSIPVYPEISQDQQDKVVATIVDFIEIG